MESKKIALVTGGNRGIGYEICRQLLQADFVVVLTARNQNLGEEAVKNLSQFKPDVHYTKLDVLNEDDYESVKTYMEDGFGKLDVLVNNAGIISSNANTASVSRSELLSTINNNFIGPFMLTQKLLPLLKKSPSGKVINVSSGMGALSEMGGGHAAYRISKTALNAMTTAMSADLSQTGIKVFSMCPGWVRTRLGGDMAPRNVQQGAETAIWLATNEKIPGGGFYRDKQIIAW